jgi:hypothetical protein
MVNLVPICIRNTDRTTGNDSNFNVKVTSSMSGISKLSIRDVQIPISMYPIANNINNTLKVNGNLVTIDEGVYDLSTFLTELKAKLDASPGGITYTVTQDSKTKKITIAGTLTFTLDLSASNSLFRVLGFDQTLYPTALSHTGPYILNLNQRLECFFVYSRRLLKHSFHTQVSNNTNPFLVILNPSTPFGSVLRYEPQSVSLIYNYKVFAKLNLVDIQITDANNEPIDFNNQQFIMNLIGYAQ